MLAVARACQANGPRWLSESDDTREAMTIVAEELRPFSPEMGHCSFASGESIQAIARTGTPPVRVRNWGGGRLQEVRAALQDRLRCDACHSCMRALHASRTCMRLVPGYHDLWCTCVITMAALENA